MIYEQESSFFVKIPIIMDDRELKESNQIITLRQLLNNTSGFGSIFFRPNFISSNLKIGSMKTIPYYSNLEQHMLMEQVWIG